MSARRFRQLETSWPSSFRRPISAATADGDEVKSSRVNYESIEYNKRIPDSIFAKPSNTKELRKDLKLKD